MSPTRTVPSSNTLVVINDFKEIPTPSHSHLPRFRSLSPSEEIAACEVIGSRDAEDISRTCPCCNRRRSNASEQETLDEPCISSRRDLPSVLDGEIDDASDDDEESDILPGVLKKGVRYHPKRIVAEGWVHKKGTGKDWMGSRAWKPRWARLLLARVEGYDVDVPLLSMYWFPTGTTPSTVIVLDSTVVVPVEKDKDAWNAHCFHVIHARHGADGEDDIARTFSVPRKERDSWVYTINQVLLEYEKEKARCRKEAQALAEMARPTSPMSSSVWLGDRFLTQGSASIDRPMSPTLSPRSSSARKLPLPRHK